MRLEGFLNERTDEKIQVINEFDIKRGKLAKVISLEVFIDDVYLTTCKGDGLIICSQTGSTAYGLNAGGPIIQTEVRSITMVPICPMSLSFRPIVLPSFVKIKLFLKMESRGTAVISGDGLKSIEFNKNESFTICGSSLDLQLVHSSLKSCLFEDWISKLRQTLSWNNPYHNRTLN